MTREWLSNQDPAAPLSPEPRLHSVSSAPGLRPTAPASPFSADTDRGGEIAAEAARARLGDRLGVPMAPPDGATNVRVGAVLGWTARVEPFELLERALLMPRPDSSVRLTTPDATHSLGNEGRPSLGEAVAEMAAGWTVEIDGAAGVDPLVDDLLDDLAAAWGPLSSRLVCGLGSALGPATLPAPGPTMLLQLAGTRSVLIGDGEARHQVEIRPGQALIGGPGMIAHHLPRDGITMHLRVVAADSPDHVARPAQSGARGLMGLALSDPLTGVPVRWMSGPPVLTTTSADRFEIWAAGCLLVVNDAGLLVLGTLCDGQPVSGGDLAGALGLDPASTVAFCERLAQQGLVRADGPEEAAAGGSHLLEVARAEAVPPALRTRLAEAASLGGWRPPQPDEIPAGPNVEVQTLPADLDAALFTVLRPTLWSMNEQFYQLDVRGPRADDPPLLVRTVPEAPTGEVGLGSDLVGHPTRKLTWALSVVDGVGGWVQLPAGSNRADPSSGTASSWPSFRPWRLDPSVEAERLLVVGRLHGPPFS